MMKTVGHEMRLSRFVFALLFLSFWTPSAGATEQAPVEQEEPPYTLSGYTFGDYFYNVTRDENVGTLSDVALPGEEDLNGFIIRRLYFTYDDKISKDFFTRFRLEASATEVLPNGKTTVFVKDAYLQWIDALGWNDFYFGIQPTPAWEISEPAWRYRSLEKTILDLRGIATARDLGVSLRGKFDSSGKYNYWIEFGNGSGNTPETDEFKRLYLDFHWKPSDKVQFTAYQDFRFLPEIPDPNDAAGTLDNDSYTTAFFANYGRQDKYGLGYEGFFTQQKNGTTLGSSAPFEVDAKISVGHSFWAWYDFNSVVGMVGRYDFYDPNNNSAVKGDVRDLFIGSVVLRPHPNVWIMPNIHIETYQETPDGQSFDASVTARITFYYIFL
jgi:hypothetical protein